MIFNQTYVSPPYAPIIWNDTGHYDYFYIDFKKTLVPFSMGMFVESILVYGTTTIPITGMEKINATTCKVYANISELIHGLLVMSKSPTRLKLSSGKELPAFSSFMFVSGVSSYLDTGYNYETLDMYNAYTHNTVSEEFETLLPEPYVFTPYESATVPTGWDTASVSENLTVTLI